jgi:hypothetical protein
MNGIIIITVTIGAEKPLYWHFIPLVESLAIKIPLFSVIDANLAVRTSLSALSEPR